MIIPYLCLTMGQQGGIGYPPVIVQHKKRWYAISDSREKRAPEEIELFLEHIKMFLSSYGHKRNPKWHPQTFVMTKWRNAPKLTWEELKNQIRRSNNDTTIKTQQRTS